MTSLRSTGCARAARLVSLGLAMRITTRMTLTLTALALVVLGGYGFYVARRSQQELEDTVERRTKLIVYALLAGIEHDLREGSWADIQDTLDRLDGHEIDACIVDGVGQVQAASPGAAAVDDRERAAIMRALGGEDNFTVLHDEDPMRALYAAPLADGHGDLIGAVSVSQRLVGLTAAVEETRRDAAIAVVAFVLAAAAAGSWIGRVHVGAPIGRLVAAMRRVREGQLAGVGAREQTTEIQELGREFDLMVAQLAMARRELIDAEAGRTDLERRLQRADKLISIGQLAAGVAHEIGSPLQVLVGRARAIATRDYDASDVRRQAVIIADQGERIAAIVERLLDFARRHPARPVPTSAAESAASVVDLLSAEAERRGVTLRCVREAALPPVMSPPGELQQIVLNLTLNALDATGRGGDVAVEVRPASSNEAQGIEVVVADTGRGIPDDERDRVFDAFFTTRAEQGGTGLGLAVVRSLVVDHGGRITLESTVGRGTRIAVWLPSASLEATS
jgi:signal transduction histidine kinase